MAGAGQVAIWDVTCANAEHTLTGLERVREHEPSDRR